MTTSYQVVLLAAIIGVLPVTWWLWVIVRENYFGKGGVNLLIEIFFWGVLAAIPASILEMLVAETGGGTQIVLWMHKLWLFGEVPFQFTAFWSAFLIAVIEEISKLIAIVIALGYRKVNNLNEGLIVGIVVGLAFAVTENGVYFASAVQIREMVDFGSLVMLRFIVSTSAHIIYSGIAGILLAKARLATGFFRAQFAFLAVLLPTLIHAIFNFLLGGPRGINSSILSVVTAIGLLILWRQYQGNKNLQRKLINKKLVKLKNAKRSK